MSDDSSTVRSEAQSPVVVPLPSRPYRFTWDPASRRSGPASVSGTTEGRGGDDFGPPPPLTSFNNSSLALASLPTEWSSSRTGFHGISPPPFVYYTLVDLIYFSYINRTEQSS